MPADTKASISEKIEALKKSIACDNLEDNKNASAALSLEIQKIGQILYNSPKEPEDKNNDTKKQDEPTGA